MTTSDSEFGDRLLGYFAEGEAATSADNALREYFEPGFTGAHFELLADDDPNRITARDLVAVSMLGVSVPAGVAIWLLSPEGSSQVEGLLSDVPDQMDIWEAGDVLMKDQPLWRLWYLLGEASWPAWTPANGMGMTKTSKLIAVKRPRLVPVVDSVVAKVLPSANYWASFAEALLQPTARDIIVSATPSAPAHLSLLRRIDVVLWMLNHADTRRPAHTGGN